MHCARLIAFPLLAVLASLLPQQSRAAEGAPVATAPADKPTHPAQDQPTDAPSQRAQQLWRTHQSATFNALSTSSNPRDWVLATLIDPWGEQTDQQTALLERARAAAPNDTVVQWIALHRASQSDTRRDILRNLERLEGSFDASHAAQGPGRD